MTTYYVKAEGGSDGAAGTSPAAAWATVQYADTQISAGDTVWLSPGQHRLTGPEWAMQSSGSSGSPIYWKGDFLGVEFDVDRGEVVITDYVRPHNDPDTGFVWDVMTLPYVLEDTGIPTRMIDTNGAEWVEMQYIHFMNSGYSDSGLYTFMFPTGSPSGAHYGWRIRDCFFYGKQFANNRYTIRMTYDKTDGDVPDGSEVIFERNVFVGACIYVEMDESPTVQCNFKFTVQANVFVGRGQNFNAVRGVNTTYESGGFLLRNNTFAYTEYAPMTGSTAQNLKAVYNNIFAGNAVVYDIDNADLNRQCNMGMGGLGDPLHRDAGRSQASIIISLGGGFDTTHRAIYGWTPWLPWQPFTAGGLHGVSAGANETADAPTYDLYGYPLDEACGTALFWADESYEPVGAVPVWSGEEKFYDAINDTQVYGAAGSVGPIVAAGLNNADVSGFPTERYISVATDCHPGNGASAAGTCDVEYLAETLYSGQNIWGVVPAGRGAYEIFNREFTPPAGGWTRDVLTKMRLRMTLNNLGTSNAYAYNWKVACELYRARAIGAVAGPAPLEEETTVVNTPGGSSGRIGAWGWWQKPMFLAAGSYTYTIYARYASAYTGTKPTLEIDVPEDGATYTDTMTGAADQWEQLSVGFTLTEGRTVVLRLRSYNTVQFGYAYFDDLEQA